MKYLAGLPRDKTRVTQRTGLAQSVPVQLVGASSVSEMSESLSKMFNKEYVHNFFDSLVCECYNIF